MSAQSAHVPRRSQRQKVSVSSALRHSKSWRVIEAPLYDLSPEGCRLLTGDSVKVGTAVLVKIDGLEGWPAIVMWKTESELGVEFQAPLSPYVVDHYVSLHGLRD